MRFRTLAAAGLAAAAFATIGATAASASTGPGSNGQAGQLTGNRAAVYADPYFGPVQCNETQHAKFDTVSCHFTGGQVQAPGTAGSVGWNSDFGAASIRLATGTLAYAINAAGDGYTGQATYPAG